MATRSRYRSFMAKENLRIIEEAENIGNRAVGWKYDVSESCICDWRKNKARLKEMNSNRWTFRSQKVRHLELEKKGCAIMWTINDNTDVPVTSEMYQFKAIAITKELEITGLSLPQVAADRQVPTWLVAGIGVAWQRPSMHSTHMPHWPLQ